MPTPPDAAPTPWRPAAELRVTEPAAVDILWYPARRVHLHPFLGRAAGLAEAAALLGLKKPAMSYWIGRLLEAGLIRPWDEVRAGRQRIARYRCIADRLRVSLQDAPLSSYEGVFDDASARWHPVARQSLAKALARQAPLLDLTVHAGTAGGLGSTLRPRGDEPAADDYLYYWGRLWLSAAERDALRAELDALWDRYVALSDASAKPCPTLVHLLHVADSTR